MEKTSIGLDENIAGLLCYALIWLSGLVIYLLETENKLVRFHALQSFIVFGVLNIAVIVFSWIPLVNVAFISIISLIMVVLWILLMIRTYQGQKIKIPWAGDIAEKRAEQ